MLQESLGYFETYDCTWGEKMHCWGAKTKPDRVFQRPAFSQLIGSQGLFLDPNSSFLGDLLLHRHFWQVAALLSPSCPSPGEAAPLEELAGY